jgi:hypothetical protein
LGVTLSQPVAELAFGLAMLSKYLPRLELETYGDRDFLYRINRRRISQSAHHVQFNRLASWSLEEVQSSSVQFGAAHRSPKVTSTPSLLIRLVLDINTVASSAISVDRMPALFAECIESAREIAVNGDVQ